jgi:hypothetical protein
MARKTYYLEICIASSVTKILAKKLYRFIRFFSQKLCICIALNDTFLRIAAHHCTNLAKSSKFANFSLKHGEQN